MEEERSRVIRVVLFLVLGSLKTVLALKGIDTYRQHLAALIANKPTSVPEATRYLWLYFIVNVADEIKAVVDGEHLTSHLHHIVSGCEC